MQSERSGIAEVDGGTVGSELIEREEATVTKRA
jgi:hypothetical protein